MTRTRAGVVHDRGDGYVRAVVDDDDLEVDVKLVEHGRERDLEQPATVASRDHD